MSIRQIAKKTGVSVATVSRVMNNSSLVNPETRQKILAMMAKSNYKRKRVKRTLPTIGVAIPDFKPGRLNYIYIREFLAGIMETAARFDTSVKVLDLNDIVHIANRPGAYSDFCREKGVGALIHIQAPISFHEYIERLADDGIPQVVIEHQFDRPDIGWIAMDNLGSSRHLAEYLMRLKYERFAIITPSRQFQGHHDRYTGYVSALAKQGITIPREWDIERPTVTAEAGSSAVLNMLTGSKTVPQVIYFTNVEHALGGMQALTTRGLRVPEDVIVCLVDDSQHSHWVSQPVLYLCQPAFEIGTRCTEYLLTRKPGETLQQVIVPELFISPKVLEVSGK